MQMASVVRAVRWANLEDIAKRKQLVTLVGYRLQSVQPTWLTMAQDRRNPQVAFQDYLLERIDS